MEFLSMLAMACLINPTLKAKPNCEAYLKTCVEWVVAQPESKARDFDSEKVAAYLLNKSDAHLKICR